MVSFTPAPLVLNRPIDDRLGGVGEALRTGIQEGLEKGRQQKVMNVISEGLQGKFSNQGELIQKLAQAGADQEDIQFALTALTGQKEQAGAEALAQEVGVSPAVAQAGPTAVGAAAQAKIAQQQQERLAETAAAEQKDTEARIKIAERQVKVAEDAEKRAAAAEGNETALAAAKVISEQTRQGLLQAQTELARAKATAEGAEGVDIGAAGTFKVAIKKRSEGGTTGNPSIDGLTPEQAGDIAKIELEEQTSKTDKLLGLVEISLGGTSDLKELEQFAGNPEAADFAIETLVNADPLLGRFFKREKEDAVLGTAPAPSDALPQDITTASPDQVSALTDAQMREIITAFGDPTSAVTQELVDAVLAEDAARRQSAIAQEND